MTREAIKLTLAAAALVAAAFAGGCRGDRSDNEPRQFFPDMDDQPKYKAQAESTYFEDGRTMRVPVAGTVAFGPSSDPDHPDRRWMGPGGSAVRLGVDASGNYVQTAPVREILGKGAGETVTERDVAALIRQGQERYDIFCAACHNYNGDGKGMVGNRWSYALPTYHDAKYYPGGEKGQDGYLFHVARNGVANTPGVEPALKMQGYGQKLTIEETWAIVLYMRTLQKTRNGALRDVPEQLVQPLLERRGAILREEAAQAPAEEAPEPQSTDAPAEEPAGEAEGQQGGE